MKAKYNIILDFDDVLYPFLAGVQEVLGSMGIDKGEEITQWALHDHYGIPKDELWAILSAPENEEALYLQPLAPGVEKALWRLWNQGHDLHIVTARTSDPGMFYTRSVVTRDNLPIESMHFTKDKEQAARDLSADFAVDDRVENYLALERGGAFAYLMDMPHNQGLKGLGARRVPDMRHFADIITTHSRKGVQLREELPAQ